MSTIGALDREFQHRGFTIVVTRDWERRSKPYTVEWFDQINTYGPVPSPMHFDSEAAALDRARELIDFQLRAETDNACMYFHGENPKGGVKRWEL